jgi:hypothetical protein
MEFEEKIKLHEKYERYSKAAENIVKLASSIDDIKYSEAVNSIKSEASKIINEG